jgi:prepilin-type N-terminal cleavage/methylation domain-containing protein
LRHGRGLSLTEVLIALVIIGILAATTVPTLSGWMADRRVKKAARQLVTDLQFARMRSLAEGVEYRISFDNADGSYNIQRGNQSADSDVWTQAGMARCLSVETNPYYARGVVLRQNYPGNTAVFTPAGYAGMGTSKLSTGPCSNGSIECQASPSRRCERCVRTLLTGRVALVE